MPTTVEARNTFPGTTRAWLDGWFNAFVLAFDARGVPVEMAIPLAMWITVHLWRETGAGRYEWGLAPGNIKCRGTPDPPSQPGWHGQCHVLSVRGRDGEYGPQSYRDYATRADFAADYLQLLESPTYRASWRYLLDHPDDGAGWYARLLNDGYSRYSDEAITEFQSIANRWGRARG